MKHEPDRAREPFRVRSPHDVGEFHATDDPSEPQRRSIDCDAITVLDIRQSNVVGSGGGRMDQQRAAIVVPPRAILDILVPGHDQREGCRMLRAFMATIFSGAPAVGLISSLGCSSNATLYEKLTSTSFVTTLICGPLDIDGIVDLSC